MDNDDSVIPTCTVCWVNSFVGGVGVNVRRSLLEWKLKVIKFMLTNDDSLTHA